MGQPKKRKRICDCANVGQRTKSSILVVENNKNVQNALSWMLCSMGFEVGLADNGLEALAIFVENPFDLVLTDLEMPLMDGSSLAHFIKEMSPKTPVILLTGADRESVWSKAKSESIDSVIFKPFKADDFEKTVQETLDSREAEEGIMRPI
jgi:CheY-like chemotaxis protein